jgi:glycosyltransferase involved in cell wall biosynthesis
MDFGAGCLPVAVVMPAHNAEAFIGASLESVRLQSLPPAEIVVVDDASSDRTALVAARYGARVVTLPTNAGPSAARNAGVAASRSPWIAFLDADDLWHADKLAVQWNALRRWPDARLSFTDYDTEDVDGVMHRGEMCSATAYRRVRPRGSAGVVRFETTALARGLVRSMFLRQSSVIVARETFLQSGGYDEKLRLAEDYDLFLRLIAVTPAIVVERALVVYRRRATSLSADPLAELASIDALWEQIANRPERYCATAITEIRHQRHATLCAGGLLALRLGRFAEAEAFLSKALSSERSFAAIALDLARRLLDRPSGHRLHRVVRGAWRSRRSLSSG